jgi:Fe-Mn family superoxide dismutase
MLLSKREFCKGMAAAAVAATGGFSFAKAVAGATTAHPKETAMPFTLPPLPYEPTALEPHISANTLSFHHGKHHAAYVNKLNELIAGTEYEALTLEDIIKKTAGAAAGSKESQIFNNAAQVWNHTFYWHCMKGNGGGKPSGEIARKIDSDLGGFDKFKEDFKAAAVSQFGSGWAWLVLDGGKVKIVKTGNADLPMAHGQKALLTCDVWEHAYYLDYQNRRPDYVGTFLDKLVNWEFVEKQLA